MRSRLLSGLLLGATVLAPFAQAQWDYGTTVQVTRLAGPPLSLQGSDEVSDFWTERIAIDPNGILFGVSGDRENRWILKFSPDQKITKRTVFFSVAAGKRVSDTLASSQGLAVDAQGNAYVTTNHEVWKIAPDGATVMLTDGLEFAQGIAVDLSGNLYVAESEGHTIRKISPDGIVTVFAGRLGEPGSDDGTSSARFRNPAGVVVDAGGNVFVADQGNHTIRKITAEGVVSTVAGLANRAGLVDGVGAVARFRKPSSVAIDSVGALLVVDDARYRLRRITPDGSVNTLSVSGGFEDLIEAGFIGSVAVGKNGTIYVADVWYGATLMSAAPPSFTVPLASQKAVPGESASFHIVADGAAPIAYQWLKDGITIPEATNATLTIDNVQASSLGTYAVRATNAVGGVTSNSAALFDRAAEGDGIMNLSIRGSAGSGAQTLIVGLVLGDASTSGTKPLLFRGVGPTLGASGVGGFLSDPAIDVFFGNQSVGSNDNWNGDAQLSGVGADVGAFAFVSKASRDAALYHAGLGIGAYSVQVSGVGGTRGIALVEVYDATPAGGFAASSPRLINASARAHVGTGADILVANFTLAGTAARTLLVRAIGPTLSTFGVTDPLADPKLDFFRGASLLQSNDNWDGDDRVASAAAKAGAFALDPTGRDAALLITLSPGSYSAHVSGVADTTGVALVEIYEVP